jgi:hypothetical protein
MDASKQAILKKAHSVAEFCDEHCISRAFFYLLRRRGDAPRMMKVGRRTLISTQAAEDWRRAMEERIAVGASDQRIRSIQAVQL